MTFPRLIPSRRNPIFPGLLRDLHTVPQRRWWASAPGVWDIRNCYYTERSQCTVLPEVHICDLLWRVRVKPGGLQTRLLRGFLELVFPSLSPKKVKTFLLYKL